MDAITARPQLLKQANISLIRNAIKSRDTVTRAEIAEDTGISSTTVRSLLAEMMENSEIESIGYDESSGGRKAERYRFRPERYHAAVFCTVDDEAHFLLVNTCGEIVEERPIEIIEGDFLGPMTTCLDALIKEHDLKAIGLGVPGVVEGHSYWKKRPWDEKLYRIDIGEALAQRYGLPVVLENDLKATTIGFGRCYQNSYPNEDPENTNMAYVHFRDDCISAGFLSGGRIIRGHNNFSGELGLLPAENGRPLDEYFSSPLSDIDYVNLVAKVLSWICTILDPQYIALGGPTFRKDCLGAIGSALSSLLPHNMLPEILYASDMWHDYHMGMAHLTAAKMFDEVQFSLT